MALSRVDSLPLIVIVGPTASGKTSLAIDLAKRYNGEIICADSRTIYKGMDVGTAKPTLEEQRQVPHWGLDLVEPGERFTAADFKAYAVNKMYEIQSRGHIPFLVGGTGLYINGVIFDYQFGNDADKTLRETFETYTIEQLHKYCISHNIIVPDNKYNKRYVIRAIEKNNSIVKSKDSLIPSCYVVGIATEKTQLERRIAHRAEQIINDGVIEEARWLADRYGWSSEAMTGNVYPIIKCFIDNKLSVDELKTTFIIRDRQLAKRQMTWFKRNKYINWHSLSEAYAYCDSLLARLP